LAQIFLFFMVMRPTSALLIAALSTVGCQRGLIPETVPEATLVEVYADKLILQEEAKLAGLDSAATDRRLDSLYRAHRLTRPDVDSALARSARDLPAWKQFYEKVVKRLEERTRQTP
jgi:hypothetical protein